MMSLNLPIETVEAAVAYYRAQFQRPFPGVEQSWPSYLHPELDECSFDEATGSWLIANHYRPLARINATTGEVFVPTRDVAETAVLEAQVRAEQKAAAEEVN